MADVIIVAIAYLDYLSPSLTLCGSFASVSSSWRVCRKVLTLMCSWSAFPRTACGTWWISINIPPFLWLRLWRVMQSRIVIPRPPSSPWLLRRCVAIWIRILNSSEHTSSPSLQRKSTLRCSIVSPKWISLFGGFVLALSFLQVALPGGLSDPVLLYAISVVFQATLRLGAFAVCLSILGLRVAAVVFSSFPGLPCITLACLC